MNKVHYMLTRKKTNRRIYSEYERGCLEMLIDSEGAISLHRNLTHGREGDKSFEPSIEISNNCYELLEKAREIISEDIHVSRLNRPPKEQETRKISFRLRIHSQQYIRNILTQIQLIVKVIQTRRGSVRVVLQECAPYSVGIFTANFARARAAASFLILSSCIAPSRAYVVDSVFPSRPV